jgi:hypothetical protein
MKPEPGQPVIVGEIVVDLNCKRALRCNSYGFISRVPGQSFSGCLWVLQVTGRQAPLDFIGQSVML